MTRSHEVNAKTLNGQSHPADIVFLAMTHHHLGHADEARTLLARLRDLLQQDSWQADLEMPALLQEAEQPIGGDARLEAGGLSLGQGSRRLTSLF